MSEKNRFKSEREEIIKTAIKYCNNINFGSDISKFDYNNRHHLILALKEYRKSNKNFNEMDKILLNQMITNNTFIPHMTVILKEKRKKILPKKKEKKQILVSKTKKKIEILKKKPKKKVETIKKKVEKKKTSDIEKIKILILGSEGYGINAHFSENIRDEMKKYYNVEYFSEVTFHKLYNSAEWNEVRFKKRPIKISSIKTKFGTPDFVFIEETMVHFDNDTDIPVFYLHKYLHRSFCIKNPDVVFFTHPVYLKYYEMYGETYAMSKIRFKKILYPAVNPDIYKPKIKTIKGIHGIGFRATSNKKKRSGEIVKDNEVDLLEKSIHDFKKYGYDFFDPPISNKKYKEILSLLEAFWISLPRHQFISKRMLEAMACKTLCIIDLQDSKHVKILNDMGFINEKHYIGVRYLNEIRERFEEVNKEVIIENAYETVLARHTFKNRMDQIIDFYNKNFKHPKIKKPTKILISKKKEEILKKEVNENFVSKNVLISTIEKCGVSWFVRIISLVYEQMFGGRLKKWRFNTSRLMAGHPDYPIQKGWNTVRYTPIEDIIKKPHNKIILLQRQFESWKKDLYTYHYCLYMKDDKYYYNDFIKGHKKIGEYEEEKDQPEHKEWFDKLKKYYDQTYKKTDSPNVLRINLEDLNNYTVATFNEVLDFLGFPKEGRPLILPVNPPERVWQAYSAVYQKGGLINERLQMLHEKYNKNELEFIEQGNHSIVSSEDTFIYNKKILTPIEQKVQEGRLMNMNPFYPILDTLKILKGSHDILDDILREKYDIICPIYWINPEYFIDNIKTWLREIPTKRLILGIANPKIKFKKEWFDKLKEVVPDYCRIEIINQKEYKTLGICLADLMKRVKSKWFVYLHADVNLTLGCFKLMEECILPDVGIIESERKFFDGKKYKNGFTHNRKRSYSGFQLFQKKAVENLILEIEDDFIYRNEDIIFQARCKQNGFRYIKVLAWHIHQLVNTQWTYSRKETQYMQWKGLIKYTQPDEETRAVYIGAIKQCKKYGNFGLNHILQFIYQYNPNWGRFVIKKWEE